MFARILVGFDDSEASRRAFSVALDLAKHYRSELHVCSVIEDLPRYAGELVGEVEDIIEHARRHFDLAQDRLAEQAEREGISFQRHILPGHPVEAIVHLADQERADCIVLGGLGHSGILRRASGGTGSQIAYHAHCSVFVVR